MIPILFENENFLVANKPEGLSFHKDQSTGGMFSLLELQQNMKLFAVHRLDKVTSGVMLFAKNSETASMLGSLFNSKKITKTYIALSDKRPSKKQGMIKGDIEKGRGGSYKLLRSSLNPSFTKFTSTFVDGMRIFKLMPLTGKTHQLRVVMSSIGSPILGDSRYKGTDSDRTYLHAYRIEFNLLNKEYKFKCLPSGGHYSQLNIKEIIESL